MKPVISVIIPTFHRPEGARAAVMSLLAQKNAPEFEIILIDNDKNSSASNTAEDVAKLAAAQNINFIYCIEPAPGVANARNTSLKYATGEFIAFLDDDEVAFDNWLGALYAAQQKTGAEVVFGPIEARLEAGHAEPYDYFQKFFSRTMEGETRIIEKQWGCGNSFMHHEKMLSGDTPFNPDTNETGGEDDHLWRKVARNNYKYAWAADAWVYEDVPKSRANWNYVTKRAFAYGHNTTAQCFDKNRREYVKGMMWMVKGAVQAGVMAPVAGVLWLIGNEKRAWAYDKMLRGLGKLLWFGPFKQSFYGLSSQYLKDAEKSNKNK